MFAELVPAVSFGRMFLFIFLPGLVVLSMIPGGSVGFKVLENCAFYMWAGVSGVLQHLTSAISKGS